MTTFARTEPVRNPSEDKLSLQEIVRLLLCRIGLLPVSDFRTEPSTTAPTVLVTFTTALPPAAWDILTGLDVASDGDHALRIGYPSTFAEMAREAS